MANPSLQIGNDNWAIKEDDLLGYSKAGTRFVPEPITMTRASAGTRVNPEGLVETVELLGSEEVTNGDFATDSDWTLGGLATISGGNANFIDGGSNTYSYIRQNISQTSTKQYLLQFEIKNYVSGAIQVFLQGVSSIGTYNSNGVYSVVLLSGTTNGYIEISRSYSGGTYSFSIDNVSVKEYTANNLARVDYDGTASSLLAEPESTNVISYSEDFSNSYWAKSNTDVISNSAISPDGTQNADKLNFTTSSGEIVKGMAFVSGQTYTMSFYAKTESGTLDFNYGNMDYYVISGTATDEWQRFEIIQTLPTTTRFPKINTTEIGSLLLWGWQIEQQSYATSYIPTDGSTVTRVQDQYEKTGISNLINSEEGVLFVEMAALSNDGTFRQMSLSDGSTDNRILLDYTSSSNQVRMFCASGGVSQVSQIFNVTNSLSFNKIAFKYKLNDFALWVNGVEVATDLSGSVPIGLNRLTFDNGEGTFPFFGKVKQLQVFKTALTDDELTILTGTSGVHFFPSYAAMASVLTYTIE